MRKSRQAVSGNTFSKVVFGLTAVLLVFAPPTARPGGAAEAISDFRFCQGYFALCAASTCMPTGSQIAVNTITGRTRNFPPGGLHVSGHSGYVDCQLGRGQHERLLRPAGRR